MDTHDSVPTLKHFYYFSTTYSPTLNKTTSELNSTHFQTCTIQTTKQTQNNRLRLNTNHKTRAESLYSHHIWFLDSTHVYTLFLRCMLLNPYICYIHSQHTPHVIIKHATPTHDTIVSTHMPHSY
jgi:hypothetical protein